jgi:hypothetical protein
MVKSRDFFWDVIGVFNIRGMGLFETMGCTLNMNLEMPICRNAMYGAGSMKLNCMLSCVFIWAQFETSYFSDPCL